MLRLTGMNLDYLPESEFIAQADITGEGLGMVAASHVVGGLSGTINFSFVEHNVLSINTHADLSKFTSVAQIAAIFVAHI